MKYKAGDKVRVKSFQWWLNQPKKANGSVDCGDNTFTKEMTGLCGEIVEISAVYKNEYRIIGSSYYWTEEMFEDENQTPHRLIPKIIIAIADAIKKHNLGVSVSEKDGKLIIEPLNEKEEAHKELEEGTPVMVTDSFDEPWALRYYFKNGYCKMYDRSSEFYLPPYQFKYTIPFDKFDPNNIEESLKYNINNIKDKNNVRAAGTKEHNV